MSKPRLVLVANDVGGPGGMETHLEEMIDRLKYKYEITVVASSLRVRDSAGVQYIHVPVIRRPFPVRGVIFAIVASIRLLGVRKGSIIHTTGAIIPGRVDVSTVHFCHAGWKRSVTHRERSQSSVLFKWNDTLSTEIKLWFERRCYKPNQTRHLIAVSNSVAQELSENYPYPSGSISVISNGVDIERFKPAALEEKQTLRRTANLPATGTFAVFVGGDWERKGVRYLLEAFSHLASQYSELHVLVVGVGDIEKFRNIAPRAYRERVHFVGRQSNPERWYRMSDIFVFPSNYEACSLAVLEAAASGLAMVLTRVGAAEDLVQDGVAGYFIERNSTSIEGVLRRMLDNPLVIQRMGNVARRRVEQFTWDETARKFEDVYAEVIFQKEE